MASALLWQDVFDKHGATLSKAGANPNNGLGAVLGGGGKVMRIVDNEAEFLDMLDSTYQDTC